MTASKLISQSLMMIFLLCLTTPMALPARADMIDETDTSRPTPDSLVTAYYNRCLNTVYQDLAPETRQEFCACTSAHIKDAMLRSDLETMATGKGPPVDQKTLAVKVMVPCLSAPMDELEYNTCMGDDTYTHMFKSANAFNDMCHCVSAGIARFVHEYGGDLMAYVVSMDASTANDPAVSLRQSGAYVTERARLHNECLNKNAYQ